VTEGDDDALPGSDDEDVDAVRVAWIQTGKVGRRQGPVLRPGLAPAAASAATVRESASCTHQSINHIRTHKDRLDKIRK